jgi:hypothetical protein
MFSKFCSLLHLLGRELGEFMPELVGRHQKKTREGLERRLVWSARMSTSESSINFESRDTKKGGDL